MIFGPGLITNPSYAFAVRTTPSGFVAAFAKMRAAEPKNPHSGECGYGGHGKNTHYPPAYGLSKRPAITV